MKNVLLLLACFFAAVFMSSCTAESIEIEKPSVSADGTVPPVVVPPGIDHGGASKDKDKDNN